MDPCGTPEIKLPLLLLVSLIEINCSLWLKKVWTVLCDVSDRLRYFSLSSYKWLTQSNAFCTSINKAETKQLSPNELNSITY